MLKFNFSSVRSGPKREILEDQILILQRHDIRLILGRCQDTFFITWHPSLTIHKAFSMNDALQDCTINPRVSCCTSNEHLVVSKSLLLGFPLPHKF